MITTNNTLPKTIASGDADAFVIDCIASAIIINPKNTVVLIILISLVVGN
jgi:hypothetical protein